MQEEILLAGKAGWPHELQCGAQLQERPEQEEEGKFWKCRIQPAQSCKFRDIHVISIFWICVSISIQWFNVSVVSNIIIQFYCNLFFIILIMLLYE